MSQTIKELTRTGISILLEEPYLGHFSMGILKEASTQIDRIGLGLEAGIPKLLVNPVYWLKDGLSDIHRYGLLKHELLHLALQHPLKAHQYTHRRLFNIAADIVVNQYIPIHQLPDKSIRLQDFAGLRMTAYCDVDYYYYQLLQTVRAGGGGKAKAYLSELLKVPVHDYLQQHKYWYTSFSNLSSAERRNLQQNITSLLQTAALQHREGGEQQGLPEQLIAFLPRHQQKRQASIDWRRALRLFAASSERTYLKTTIKRPSRRFGTTPGIKVRRRQKILVVVDSSASLDLDMLNRFFGEIYHIWRQGAAILVVECDIVLQRQYHYKGKTPNFVKGRGGTDFNPPIRFANEEYFPDAIVYFTDGRAIAPKEYPRSPMLWLISPDGIDEKDNRWQMLPGRKIKMNF